MIRAQSGAKRKGMAIFAGWAGVKPRPPESRCSLNVSRLDVRDFLIAEISAIRNGSFALFSASYGDF